LKEIEYGGPTFDSRLANGKQICDILGFKISISIPPLRVFCYEIPAVIERPRTGDKGSAVSINKVLLRAIMRFEGGIGSSFIWIIIGHFN
jgi:hypothetical protein